MHRFQPTPPHRGRLVQLNTDEVVGNFNPRPRTGGDSRKVAWRNGSTWISTHAPAQGATFTLIVVNYNQTKDFNPRPRTGGDAVMFDRDALGVTFQPTPPHRGRPYLPPVGVPDSNFNPRPRTGGDFLDNPHLQTARNFNPRPRTGGDGPTILRKGWTFRFQPTPPHRGRPCFA